MKIFLEIYKNFKLDKYNKKFLLLYIFSFFNVFLEIFSLSLLLPIIGVLFDTNILNKYPFFKETILFVNPLKLFLQLDEQKNLLGGLCTLYFNIIFTKNIFLYFTMKYMTKITYNIGLELKSNFLSNIIDMSYLKISKQKLSGLVTFNNNIEFIKESLAIILSISIEFILIFGILIFLFFNNPQAMLMIFIIVFSLFLFNKFYLKEKLSYFSSKIKINEKEHTNFLLTTLRGIKNIRLDGVKNYFLNKFRYHLSKSNEANYGFAILSGSMRLIIEIMTAGLICIILTFFILNNYAISEIIATMAIFLAGGLKILPSLNKITVAYQTLEYTKDRLEDLNLFYIQNLTENKKVIPIMFEKNFELKNLKFSYNNEKIVFEDSNFIFSKGDKIYINGESGSGKSTLMNIISGLIKINKGELNIDGSKLVYEFKILNLGYITQRPFFVSDTILNNVCFGQKKEDQNIDKAIECLKDAKIYDDIAKLPENLNTLLVNDGEGFSGGQLQRISLARLLYKNSDLMILDEFTNALDIENEDKILNTLFTKYRDKTIIIVSHKYYKNLKFNKKYSIKNNKIISI